MRFTLVFWLEIKRYQKMNRLELQSFEIFVLIVSMMVGIWGSESGNYTLYLAGLGGIIGLILTYLIPPIHRARMNEIRMIEEYQEKHEAA